MTKKEVFEYMDSGIDRNGSLKKEIGFRNRFPELYAEYLVSTFPEKIKNLPFKQKLWHFLNDEYEIPVCKVCGKPVRFESSRGLWGYRTYCSVKCGLGNPETVSKRERTCEMRYGMKNYNQTDEYKGRTDIQERIYETRKENNTVSSSSVERGFKAYLESKRIRFEYQYRSEKYPYTCDFFISGIDLYIEIQGNWTHGGHPFGIGDGDSETVRKWKSKGTDYYRQAIYVWTDLDVRKRETARKNSLNYLELFSDSLEKCIDMFEEYMKNFSRL